MKFADFDTKTVLLCDIYTWYPPGEALAIENA